MRAASGIVAAAAALASVHGYRNIAYFTEWSTSSDLTQVAWSSITHLNYAFAIPQPNGTLVFLDPTASLAKPHPSVAGQLQGLLGLAHTLKRLNRGTKVGLSVGGFTGSDAFSAIAASPALRATFVASAVRLVEDLGLDHVDLDWEFPAAQDMANFVALLRELKAALVSLPYTAELTIAAPGHEIPDWAQYMASICSTVDSVNLMTYDFMGGWSPVTGYHSNLYAASNATPAGQLSVDRAVKFYVQNKCPPSKVVVGAPIYGRAFNQTSGLHAQYTNSVADNAVPYNAIPVQNEQFDDATQSAFVYNATTRQFIGYDSPRSVAAKAAYVDANQLGGLMFWETATDRSGARALVPTPVATLGRSAFVFTPNNLYYPRSKYNNVAAPPPAVPLTLVTRQNKVLSQSNGKLVVVDVPPIAATFTYDPTSKLLSAGSAGCIDAYPNPSSPSQYSVHLWPCSAANVNQRWVIDVADHRVRHATHPNVCIDVDGPTVQVWWCHDHSVNQNQWLGQPQETVTFTAFNGVHLSAALATGRVAFQMNGHAWTVDHAGQTIQWGSSGLCLDAYQPWNGGAVHLWSCDKSNRNQLWKFDPATRQLRHASHDRLCLDMASDAGTSPHLWSCHDPQNWYFRYQQFSYAHLDPSFRS